MRYIRMCAASAAILLYASIAAGDEVEDVIKLSKEGVAEDTILAFVETCKGGFDLNADRILELKRQKVSERVIAAMLRKRGADTLSSQGKPTVDKQARPETAENAVQVGVENTDSKALYVEADEASRVLSVCSSASDGATAVKAGSTANFRIRPGKWEIRWKGEAGGVPLEIGGGGTLIILSRVSTEELEAVYASVFEGSEKKGGGRLVTLRGAAPAGEAKGKTEKTATQPAEGESGKSGYRSDGAGKDTGCEGKEEKRTEKSPPETTTETRIVEREIYYVPPVTVPSVSYCYSYYIAPRPVVCLPPPSVAYWSFRRWPSCYGYVTHYCTSPSFSFSYSHFSRKTGIGIGIGF